MSKKKDGLQGCLGQRKTGHVVKGNLGLDMVEVVPLKVHQQLQEETAQVRRMVAELALTVTALQARVDSQAAVCKMLQQQAAHTDNLHTMADAEGDMHEHADEEAGDSKGAGPTPPASAPVLEGSTRTADVHGKVPVFVCVEAHAHNEGPTKGTRNLARSGTRDLLRAEDPPLNMEDEGDTELDSLYAYALVVLLMAKPKYQAEAASLMVLLLAMQTFLAFSFMDAGTLLILISQKPLFYPSVSPNLFYPGSILANEFTTSAGMVVTKVQALVNVICTIIALVLISFYLKTMIGSTLRLPNPIEALIWLSPADRQKHASASRHPYRVKVLDRCSFICGTVFLQLCWACRVIFLPITSLVGTVVVLCNAIAATDIVLNSVAIVFVFELDELFAKWLLTTRHRKLYRTLTEMPTYKKSLQPVEGSPVMFVGLWTLFAVDIYLALSMYMFGTLKIRLMGSYNPPAMGAKEFLFVSIFVHGAVLSVVVLFYTWAQHPKVTGAASIVSVATYSFFLTVTIFAAYGLLAVYWATIGMQDTTDVILDGQDLTINRCLNDEPDADCSSYATNLQVYYDILRPKGRDRVPFFGDSVDGGKGPFS